MKHACLIPLLEKMKFLAKNTHVCSKIGKLMVIWTVSSVSCRQIVTLYIADLSFLEVLLFSNGSR